MMKFFTNDTIAAIATAIGQGGIGIVRLSGPAAVAVAEKIFTPASGEKVSQFKTHTVHFGRVRDATGDVVDQVLLTVMHQPKSYTGEDVVEISSHGGTVSLKAILSLALNHGARLAEPGEFTRRAFVNGRMDLVQAEAVLDIIQAKTDSFLKVSTSHLQGDLSRTLAAIREQLLELYTQLEAIVNFPEEEVDSFDRGAFQMALAAAQKRVEDLIATGDEGRLLKEGIRVVICGRPNVGKSSLLNVLLRQPRAIVSAIAGTTRDTIEETISIDGIPVQLIDTAGILAPRDEIEVEAVRRSRESMQNADLIIFVLDASHPLTEEDLQIREAIGTRKVVIAATKSDLKQILSEPKLQDFCPGHRLFYVSAQTRQGMEELKAAIGSEMLHGQPIDTHRVVVTNLRHIESLRECQQSLARAADSLDQRLSPEFVSEEIRGGIHSLDRITGRDIDADLLDKIFANFCIGK